MISPDFVGSSFIREPSRIPAWGMGEAVPSGPDCSRSEDAGGFERYQQRNSRSVVFELLVAAHNSILKLVLAAADG